MDGDSIITGIGDAIHMATGAMVIHCEDLQGNGSKLCAKDECAAPINYRSTIEVHSTRRQAQMSRTCNDEQWKCCRFTTGYGIASHG